MRRIYVILILATCSLSVSFGQNYPDTIALKKAFGSYQFYYEGEKLNLNQLMITLESNEQAYQEIKAARSNYITASVISGVGGYLIGWELGAALGGGSPNWKMAGAGLGLVAISIPINNAFNRQAKQAIHTFNNGQMPPDESIREKKKDLKISVNSNGAGLLINF